MDLFTINYIKNNPLIYKYLRENSYWYKYLNRSSRYLKELEKEMKEKYKMTTKDKIENISNSINLISNLIDVLK